MEVILAAKRAEKDHWESTFLSHDHKGILSAALPEERCETLMIRYAGLMPPPWDGDRHLFRDFATPKISKSGGSRPYMTTGEGNRER
jgi:hypothetical protein